MFTLIYSVTVIVYFGLMGFMVRDHWDTYLQFTLSDIVLTLIMMVIGIIPIANTIMAAIIIWYILVHYGDSVIVFRNNRGRKE